MTGRRNWLEPAVYAYLACTVGLLNGGTWADVAWMRAAGGCLLLPLLVAAGIAVLLFPSVSLYERLRKK